MDLGLDGKRAIVTGARFAIASGTSTYSAWQPSIVLPNRQPPSACQPCSEPAPSCECLPHRHALASPRFALRVAERL